MSIVSISYFKSENAETDQYDAHVPGQEVVEKFNAGQTRVIVVFVQFLGIA